MIIMKKKLKVLNLYSGIGGNRKLWSNVDVTAVEINKNVAKIYKDLFPADNVIICDAHKYLLENINNDWDLIWSSPPCPTHSQFRYRCGVKAWGQKKNYPDMKLYEEIIFLKYHANCRWVVENVESYYDPLIKPYRVSRHYFWSNFHISNKNGFKKLKIKSSEVKDLQKAYNIDLTKYRIKNKRQILRNCVEPELGLHVFKCANYNVQVKLGELQT